MLKQLSVFCCVASLQTVKLPINESSFNHEILLKYVLSSVRKEKVFYFGPCIPPGKDKQLKCENCINKAISYHAVLCNIWVGRCDSDLTFSMLYIVLKEGILMRLEVWNKSATGKGKEFQQMEKL